MKNFFTHRAFTSANEQRNENLFSFRANAAEGNPRRGFTLIETFVATSVLLISLSAPLSIAAQSLRSAYYARDQVTAFYLAQEAVEYIQAKRDENYLAGIDWISGLDSCVLTACNVDFVNYIHTPCPTTCPPLRLLASSSLFNTQSGDTSVFTRSVRIIQITGTEISVQVTISWVSAGIPRSFKVSEHLFNWL